MSEWCARYQFGCKDTAFHKYMQAFAPQLLAVAQNVNLWGLQPFFKRKMERHSETLGDALQLLNGRVAPATTDTIQILTGPTNSSGQFCFTHVFFDIAFFKSIFVVAFILY